MGMAEAYSIGVDITKVSGTTTSGKDLANLWTKKEMSLKDNGTMVILTVNSPSRKKVRLFQLKEFGTTADLKEKESNGTNTEFVKYLFE